MSLQTFFKFLKKTSVEERGRKPSALPKGLCRQFSLAELKAATNNFDDDLKIREGGFCPLYKGFIDGGSLVVAVKRLSALSSGSAVEEIRIGSEEQGVEEFRNEVQVLCQLRHQNLVSLLGFCHEKDERILVYEHMTPGGLDDHLFKNDVPLPWKRRLEICIGVARGLHYLHTGAKHAIIHRGVKPSNILLDENWDAKLSDFGFSRIGPSSISKPKPKALTKTESRVYGTCGYMAPEYTIKGVYLISAIIECIKNGCVHEMIDSFLKGKIAPVCLIEFVEIALGCIHPNPNERPSMGEVEVTLELALKLQEKADLVIKADNPHAGYSYDDVSFRVSAEEIQNWRSYSYCFGGDSDAGLISDVETASEGYSYCFGGDWDAGSVSDVEMVSVPES
ncbi:hypothetical protein SLEP1_g10555 [Rubroshorea leprosula]|uniref:non-specific serine/threonine protein kinase n=1 Tax=Rubroshorea leprosula TaxID=152421 RepID=A0AAV5ICZ6_9ROSI|nr:hypothetical protein SLEP1_g10555 [Rubroshorea leprosula]